MYTDVFYDKILYNRNDIIIEITILIIFKVLSRVVDIAN